MKVAVRYFGKIRELFNIKREEYEVPEGISIADLIVNVIPEAHKEVAEVWKGTIFRTFKGEILKDKNGMPILQEYLILVNGRSCRLEHKLNNGDEVAILPPFGGG
ncbi:MAG: MoaD/ThiS family protein [Nitrososphaerota archaeon]|nr:MoaD/ThiS family protein [Candidatus Bathyarchaeota archaeon]MDW8048829.1 MoaD/ThiS family protein [Nitrososphaerota archaeon]